MTVMKHALLTLSIGIVFLAAAVTVSAASLAVTKIGSTTTPASFTQWTYTAANPTLEGTATASATVNIKIADQDFSTTANTTGTWMYTPTTLGQTGSYPVVITSGSETKSFTLNISLSSTSSSSTTSTASATTKGGVEYPDTLPQTGVFSTTLLLVLGGITFIGAGAFLYWRLIPQLVFETTSQTEEE